MAEGARLESVYTARYPGFESLSLRHKPNQQLSLPDWSRSKLQNIQGVSTQDESLFASSAPGSRSSIQIISRYNVAL